MQANIVNFAKTNIKSFYCFFLGLHFGHVLQAVLDRSPTLFSTTTRSGKVGRWRRLHQVDLGSRHILCQWKNSLLSQSHNWKSVPQNFTHWRNLKKYQVLLQLICYVEIIVSYFYIQQLLMQTSALIIFSTF